MKLKGTKLILFCLIMTFSVSFLVAIDADLRLAQGLYETKNYRRSRQIYEDLLKRNPPAWAKEEFLYNMGTLLIFEGKLSEALAKLKEIPPNTQPLVRKRVLMNIAIVQVLEAIRLSESLDDKTKTSLEAYQKGIFLFKDSLKTINEAQKVSCHLDVIKGNRACEVDPELVVMQKMIKDHYALFLQKFEKSQLNHLNLREGIPLLLTGVNAGQAHLAFFQNKNLTKEIRKSYLDYFLQKERKLLPYWETLKAQMKEEQASSLEETKLFLASEQSFQQFLQMLEKENDSEAENFLKQSAESLNLLMRQMFGKEPLAVVLQKLLASYTLALLQDPLQETALLGLKIEQEEIQAVLSSENESILNKPFKLAQKSLEMALKKLKKSKFAESRMFAEDANHAVKVMARHFDVSTENLPKKILERGIEDQEWALRMNRLNQQLENSKAQEETYALVVKSQALVLHTVQIFTEEVIKMEQERFQNSANPSLQCQKRPWDDVIPLFDHGLQDAKQAHHLLNGTPPKSRTAAALQERTIKFWKEALQSMEKPKKKKEEEQQDKEQPKSLEPMSEEKLNQTLRLLQEMEQDDRSQPKFDVGQHKPEAKPW